jgi:hypothetical protein
MLSELRCFPSCIASKLQQSIACTLHDADPSHASGTVLELHLCSLCILVSLSTATLLTCILQLFALHAARSDDAH